MLRVFKTKYKHIKNIAIYVSILVLGASCAQIVSPTGGNKDSLPPKTTFYKPDSAAIHFNSMSIEIGFNEFIQLKDIQNQLTISPPLEKFPTITTKTKTIKLEFEEDLKANTTYAINFGNAITDITEGNVLTDFRYIFSTGNYIDSLKISGSVKDAFKQTNEKDFLVMLYEVDKEKNFAVNTDSFPLTRKPTYFSKTNQDGIYQISNIKKGNYKLFALKDNNQNYLYDSQNELIGFADSLISIDTNRNFYLNIFKELANKQFIKKYYLSEPGHLVFIFNIPTTKLTITPLNFSSKKEWYLLEENKEKDTIHCWYSSISLDTLKLQLNDNANILDTLEISTVTKNKSKATEGRGIVSKSSLNAKLNTSSAFFELNNNLEILFSQPIKTIDVTKVKLSLGKDSITNYKVFFSDSSIRKRLIITHKWLPDTTYSLFIPPATIKGYLGDVNDTIKSSFKTRNADYYGTLKLKLDLSTKVSSFIFQLLDEKDNVVREVKNKDSQTVYFDFLPPQKYRMRIINDTNNNGTWDTGNYFKKLQAENVVYYDGTVNIRSNWDLEQEWKLK